MRLLVIEDDPDLRAGLCFALRKQGHAVDESADGKEGLEKALNADYDVILLDVMLPSLDGWQVLERLREKRATPVLMLTARDQCADRVRGLDAGADDYLIKPFDNAELFARLRAIIRRSAHNQAHSVITLGEVSILTASCTVTHHGNPVHLTAREYMLLEYLARRRGEVVTRMELYEYIFDENDDNLSNILDVYIHNLRRKLGRHLIETRRGLGYCLP